MARRNPVAEIFAVSLALAFIWGNVAFWDHYLGLLAVGWALLGALLIGGVATLVVCAAARSWHTLIPFGVFVVLLFALWLFPLSPVRPFVRFYRGIRPGMSRVAITAHLDACFPERGRFSKPLLYDREGGALAFILDPNDGRYNAEIITVWLDRDGRCRSKEYSAD